jgi:hypothetical protein
MKSKSSIAILVPALLVCAIPAFAQRSETYSVYDAQGHETIVHIGMPKPHHYGPKPAFAQLDRNHVGSIDREQAAAFPPLLNDFDNLAHGADRITARQYEQWDYR